MSTLEALALVGLVVLITISISAFAIATIAKR